MRGRQVRATRWAAAFALASSIGASAADYHVDGVDGRDGATGSAGDPLRQVASLAGRLQAGDTVHLASGTYDQPVRLAGRGTANAPILIRNAEGHDPVIHDTTWELAGAAHVVVEGLTFRRCPSPAFVFGEETCDSVLRRCRLLECPPPASSNLTERTAWLRAISAPGPNAHRNRIEDCEIRRPYGGYYAVNEGLNIHEANHHWVVRGNRFSGYMYGLQLGVGAQGDPPAYITIESNEFSDCNHAVHVKTSDNIVLGNHIHDMRHGYRGYGTDPLVPIWLEGGANAHVFNNILAAGARRGVGIFVSGRGMTNPVADWSPTMYKRMAGDRDPPATARLLGADYNLFFNATPPSFEWLFEEYPKWHRHYRTYGRHNLEADPRFVDREGGDFRLRPDSPARAAGRPLPNCPADLAGVARPPSRPDLGAYQGREGD